METSGEVTPRADCLVTRQQARGVAGERIRTAINLRQSFPRKRESSPWAARFRTLAR